MVPIYRVALLLSAPAIVAAVRSDINVEEELSASHLSWRREDGNASAEAFCDTIVQCIGTEQADTVWKCTCKPDSVGEPKCPATPPKDWRWCEWASASEWCEISQGMQFDFSLAAPNGKLQGIANWDAAKIVPNGVRVLTDLDDTVVCSGGGAAGVDLECEGTVVHGYYPGVAEFYYALSLGRRADVEWGKTPASPAVPFSARPAELKSWLAMRKCDDKDFALRQKICGCFDRISCTAGDPKCDCFGFDIDNGQYGKLSDTKGFFMGDFDEMGFTKADNWEKFSSDLGTPAVFVGDDGQGDVTAAQMMMLKSQKIQCPSETGCNGRVVAAFLHDVLHLCDYPECRRAWAEHNIFFFENYQEAAEKALSLGLIAESSKSKVVEAYDEAMKTWTPGTRTNVAKIGRDKCREAARHARRHLDIAETGLEVGKGN